MDLGAWFLEWGGFAFGLVGAILGLLGFLQSYSTERVTRRIQADEALNQASALLKAGGGSSLILEFTSDEQGLAEAKGLIEKAWLLAPFHPRVYRLKGAYLIAIGEGGEAEKELRKSLKLDSKSAATWYTLAAAVQRDQSRCRSDEAIEACRRAVELEPNDPLYNHSLGLLLSSTSECLEAYKCFVAALRLNSRLAPVWLGFSSLLSDLGMLEEAQMAAERAVLVDPQNAGAHFLLGSCQMELDNYEKAESSLREAIRLKPDWAQPHYLLCQVLGRTAPDQVEQERQLAVKLDPSRGVFQPDLLTMAAAHQEWRKEREREAVFSPVKSADHYASRAGELLKKGEFDGAERAIKIATVLSPNCSLYHKSHGVILVKRGRLEEAEIAFRRAAVIDPADDSTWRDLDVVYQKLGNEEAAASARSRAEALCQQGDKS